MAAAMDVGARGIVTLPLSFAQLQARLTAAAEWSVADPPHDHGRARRRPGYDESAGRARIVGFAGSKGGVGVTTLVTHLALDVGRTVPQLDVCLVDLDLEKGDVPGLIEVRHRIGLADLAKVSDDLSSGTVFDAMSRHESGVDLLLAPTDVRDVEAVTPRDLPSGARRGPAGLRPGPHRPGARTSPRSRRPPSSCATRWCMVVNPDVPSMRGMRRAFNAWESLGLLKETDVRVLLNRASRQVTVSLDTVRQLTRAAVVPTSVPAVLQPARAGHQHARPVRDPARGVVVDAAAGRSRHRPRAAGQAAATGRLGPGGRGLLRRRRRGGGRRRPRSRSRPCRPGVAAATRAPPRSSSSP